MAAEIESYLWLWDWFSPYEAHLHAISQTVFARRSEFQKIEIMETPAHGRVLVLDGEIQSYAEDEFVYHEALVQPAMILHPEPQKVLVVGGGEGATLREALRHRSVKKAVMVEIDPLMIEAAKQHLQSFHQGAFDDPRTTVVVADGRAYLAEEKELFDVIVLDLSNPRKGGLSWKLFTQEFYATAAKRLAPGGIVVVQGDVARVGGHCTFPRIVRTLETLFDAVYPYVANIASYGADWGFALAGGKEDPRTMSAEEIDRRLAQRGLEGLRFYDGITHERLFRLPKYLRERIAEEKAVSTDEQPIQETYPGGQ